MRGRSRKGSQTLLKSSWWYCHCLMPKGRQTCASRETRCLSNSPATLASYADLSKHFAKAGLSGLEMQTVLVVTSVENACAYCVAAHSTFATKLQMDPAVLLALRQGTDPP